MQNNNENLCILIIIAFMSCNSKSLCIVIITVHVLQ